MKEEKNRERVGASMPGWAKAIKSAGRDGLADLVDESIDVKRKGVLALEEYDLSRYRKIELDLVDFLDDPKQTFKNFTSPTGRYYISLTDRVSGDREHALDVKQDDVVTKIQYLLEENGLEKERTTLILSEYWRNDFSASVTVTKGGEVVTLEMVRGKHTGLTDGNAPLLLSAREDDIWHLLKFKFSEELKNNISLSLALKYLTKEILNQIPRQPDSGGEKNLRLGVEIPKLVNGYYEIAIHFDEDNEEFLIFFIDSRTKEDGEKYTSVNMDALQDRWLAFEKRSAANK